MTGRIGWWRWCTRKEDWQILHKVVFFYFFDKHETTIIKGSSVISERFVVIQDFKAKAHAGIALVSWDLVINPYHVPMTNSCEKLFCVTISAWLPWLSSSSSCVFGVLSIGWIGTFVSRKYHESCSNNCRYHYTTTMYFYFKPFACFHSCGSHILILLIYQWFYPQFFLWFSSWF